MSGVLDSALKFENQLLELQLKNDEAANSLDWPALTTEARDSLELLRRTADQHGSEQQRQKVEDLADEIEKIVAEHQTDRLRRKIEQLVRLYHEIVTAKPSWWVFQFQQAEKSRHKMKDQNRAARLFDQGQDCLAKNNAKGLQNIVRQLWELLPDEVSEAARRHPWDPGLMQ